MTVWVVDGNNVYGSRPDGWWRDRAGAARRLADSVSAWQDRQGDAVILTFDGRPDERVASVARDGLRVEFASRPGADAADDRIVEMVADEYAADPEVVVVTADRGLVDRLPPGVDVERPRRFLDRLDDLDAIPAGRRGSARR